MLDTLHRESGVHGLAEILMRKHGDFFFCAITPHTKTRFASLRSPLRSLRLRAPACRLAMRAALRQLSPPYAAARNRRRSHDALNYIQRDHALRMVLHTCLQPATARIYRATSWYAAQECRRTWFSQSVCSARRRVPLPGGFSAERCAHRSVVR